MSINTVTTQNKAAREASLADRITRGDRGPAGVAPPRRATARRRRQIDPTTCERDYSADEIEFMRALEDYKRRNGRMFPTCSEVLEVVRSLGYTRGGSI